MEKYVIIVAGGKGLRMGGDIPKQFVPINGMPVLMRTIEAFYAYDPQINIILVLPSAHQAYWKELCEEYHFSIPYQLANGGETRFHSVKNGLALIPSTGGVVGVHDGVRPFVAQSVIKECYEQAAQLQAVVPVTEVIETVRYIREDGGSETVPRDRYKLVQTPQVFTVNLLKKAYAQEYIPLFTDDASVVEHCGATVHLVKGNRENIKLTTPFDLKVAEALL